MAIYRSVNDEGQALTRQVNEPGSEKCKMQEEKRTFVQPLSGRWSGLIESSRDINPMETPGNNQGCPGTRGTTSILLAIATSTS